MANIDETNFRKCAQSAIKKYEKDGKLLDALVWMRIIGLYEAALSPTKAPKPIDQAAQ